MLHRGRLKPIAFEIKAVRELAREELVELSAPRPAPNPIAKLRDPHHNLARGIAMGLKQYEAGRRAGYSISRTSSLMKSPAFQELVAYYRKLIQEGFKAEVDETMELMTANMLKAERMIADRLEEADEEDGDPIPLKTLLSISRDAADRLGYGKKSTTNHNVNIDFASRLERAIQRSGKVINGEAQPIGEPTKLLRRV